MTIVIHPEDLSEDAAFAVPVREALHSDPEIGLHLPKTEARILAALKALKIDDVHTNIGGGAVSGIVAILRGTKPGRTIALRADTDALPIEEKTGKDYASRTPGRMHACGHDGHTAALLTVLSYLSRHRDFAGTLIAVFQPGEEGFAGSRYMIEDGLVEKFGIEEFYALHGDASVDLGKVAFFPGYAMANADAFEIVFEGKGGHGSKPQLTHDPVVAASEAVLALQTIVSRNVNPDDAAVVSVCSIEAGTHEGTSVIPQSATLRGTVRTYEKDVQDLIELRMHEIANGIAVMNYSRDVFYFDWRNCTKFQQKLELLALIGFWNASFRQINRSSPSHYRQITVIFGIDSGSGQLPNSHKQKFSYKNFRKQKISLYFLKSSIFSSNFLFNII